MSRPRIALVSVDDPEDRRAFSGTLFSMVSALRRHAGPVTALGPLHLTPRPATRVRAKASSLAGRGLYKYDHSRDLVSRYGEEFGRRLEHGAFDVVFAPVASAQIATLQTALPIMYASDATFELLVGLYDNFSNLSAASLDEGHRVEHAAVHRADLLLYPSRWAADSAVHRYGADRSRIRVTPYGANLEDPPTAASIAGRARPERCVLLFLAREWERKGGDLVLATFEVLRERGLDAELVVCGCSPPDGWSSEDARIVPFLDKNDPAQRRQLSTLLAESAFLFVPTRADCFPIVFCEASAYGLPVVATAVGGVPEAVRDGENGLLLCAEAQPEAYADAIEAAFRDEARYERLIASTRRAFDERLNWDAWGRDIAEAMRALLG
jgi:glycosyltransferase involved in cell wall biosynthesis